MVVRSKKTGAKIEFVKIGKNFEIDLEDMEKKAKNAKIVNISGASNTIATIPNMKEIEKIVHSEGGLFCVDGAQLSAHKKIDFKKIKADFFVFSGHKMLGPTGIGGMIGKKELLEKMEPFIMGGGMVNSVSGKKVTLEDSPKKFEAGTPNIAGAIGLREAVKYFEKIGFENIEKHEKKIVEKCYDGIKGMGLEIFSNNSKNRVPIVLFDFEKISCHDLAILLNEEGVAVRSGFHCAEPIVSKYNKKGLVRASFGMYNTKEETEFFLEKLEKIVKQLKK